MTKKIIPLLCLMLLLQGCMGVLAGGAVVAGGVAFINRQSLKIYYQDSNISFQINKRIRMTSSLRQNTHIVVAVYKGVVLLAGQVVLPAQRIQVQQLTQGIPGIKQIYNEITIAGPISTLTRSSDTLITSRIKSAMILNKQLKSRDIKIVTENGVVYLMGNVPATEANLAADIARREPGVQRVVTLFVVG